MNFVSFFSFIKRGFQLVEQRCLLLILQEIHIRGTQSRNECTQNFITLMIIAERVFDTLECALKPQ
jgi:hypothetical protein